jgi:ribonuclease HI
MTGSARRLNLHFDGGSRGNPGPAAVGILLADADTGAAIHEGGYFIGKTTNNVAEYKALLQGLDLAAELEPASVTIFSDSELLVRQLTGQYKVKSQALKPLFEQAQAKLVKLGDWSIQHVRREMNQTADALANAAMDAGQDVVRRSGVDEPATVEADRPPTQEPCTQWSVTLSGPGACALDLDMSGRYAFGPATPGGLCIHAAAAAFLADPLTTLATHPSAETRCARCGLTVRLTTGEPSNG